MAKVSFLNFLLQNAFLPFPLNIFTRLFPFHMHDYVAMEQQSAEIAINLPLIAVFIRN